MVSNHFLNKMLLHLEYYRGTYSANNIPAFDKYSKSIFIANLSNVGEKGTHFVVISLARNGKGVDITYFDPMGNRCKNEFLLNYMSKLAVKYNFCQVQIQGILSVFCGLYCAGHVINYHLNKGLLTKYLNIFNLDDKMDNDKIVARYINAYLDKLV